ncbi:Hypothetical predicted protein, partial [Paramuricea clavata]
MSVIKPPDPLDFTKAVTCWPDWKRCFERYRIATKLFKLKKTRSFKLAHFYTLWGMKESSYVFTQLALDEEAKDCAFVVDKFDGQFGQERNIIHERAMFHQRSHHST